MARLNDFPNIYILFGSLSSAVFPAFGTMNPKVCPIMCDDMSFYDVVCYCGEVKTPILDRLVTEGMRFIQFCNNANFTITRVSIITALRFKK